jgi:uncharacterized metal-binding protein YceD (DUF177 family)
MLLSEEDDAEGDDEDADNEVDVDASKDDVAVLEVALDGDDNEITEPLVCARCKEEMTTWSDTGLCKECLVDVGDLGD